MTAASEPERGRCGEDGTRGAQARSDDERADDPSALQTPPTISPEMQ